MKTAGGTLFGALCLVSSALMAQSAPSMHGGGATFPFPLYAKWSHAYKSVTGIQLNYQSIGSGGGIQQINSKTVDFGASEVPLAEEDLRRMGLVQFPMVMGGVVVAVNLEGVGKDVLKLDGETLGAIFAGRIVRWNDPDIAALNPGLNLPDRAISVVHRADGSGTTWLFTRYLDAESPLWRQKVGVGNAVRWPVGVGGKGNEGVASYIRQIVGSIGYVESVYADQIHLSTVLLKNRDGLFVKPTSETFKAAADQARWDSGAGGFQLTDLPGKETWPIVGASYILVYRDQKDAEKAKAMLAYFDWCLKHGAGIATELGYVPLPEAAVSMVEASWRSQIRCGGRSVWGSPEAAPETR